VLGQGVGAVRQRAGRAPWGPCGAVMHLQRGKTRSLRDRRAVCNSVGSTFPGWNPGAATREETPSDLRRRRSEGVCPYFARTEPCAQVRKFPAQLWEGAQSSRAGLVRSGSLPCSCTAAGSQSLPSIRAAKIRIVSAVVLRVGSGVGTLAVISLLLLTAAPLVPSFGHGAHLPNPGLSTPWSF
jgi:hypothetical protein